MILINKRLIGKGKEQIAADFLISRGYEILELNFRYRAGEVDIIATRDDCIVFIEVKYRKTKAQGSPIEAVTLNKQIKISNTATYFLLRNQQFLKKQVRFDVIGILDDKITHYTNAFTYKGKSFL